MNRILVSAVLVLCLCCTALAQAAKQSTQTNQAISSAGANGQNVPTNITVKNNVSAQAVLIPQIDARRIFGKEIADNYAVIEVNVGNKSPDAALIIHGVFIDYSGWGLSGANSLLSPTTINGASPGQFAPFQSSTNSSHVASEEYRVVRDQLENAQLWSKRSWTMRLLTLAGSLASAYTFSLNEQGIIKGISQFSGVFVPGFKEAWPDGSAQQLKAISDYGYKTNKVIPKQSAEIIVCFFPIDRFLTPGFKKLFVKSPALFFAPFNMLIDKTIEKDVKKVLGNDFGDSINIDTLRGSLPCYLRIDQERRAGSAPSTSAPAPLLSAMNQMTDENCFSHFGLKQTSQGGVVFQDSSDTKTKFKSFQVLDYITQMSLNNVSVTIDGAMTLDTSSMVAKIDNIKFDDVDNCGGDQLPCFWSDLTKRGGVRTGTIIGSYLTGGTVSIAEDLGIKDLQTLDAGSDDQKLSFSFRLTQPIASGTKLHFTVTKALSAAALTTATTSQSKVFEYTVAGPSISNATFDPATVPLNTASTDTVTLTIPGKGFTLSPLSPGMTLHPPSGPDLDLKGFVDSASTTEKLVFKIPVAKLKTAGCWRLVATVGANQQPATQADQKFSILVLPTVASATLAADGKSITLTGLGLDSSNCSGGSLSFTLVNGNKTFSLSKDSDATLSNSTMVTLTVPATAKPDTTSTWKIKVALGDTPLNGDGLALAKP